MNYQEKFDELQKIFSEKFDAYEKIQKKFFLRHDEKSEKFLTAKSEFEKASNDFQSFIILFRETNASPNDELGSMGQRCE
ncbi:MAG: hypothetical protein ABI834_02775 [Ginsengibacter sp.]